MSVRNNSIANGSLVALTNAFRLGNIQIYTTKNPQYEIPQNNSFDEPLVPDPDYNLLGQSLGNPVFTNLTILSGSYTDQSGNVITYPRIDLEAVLLAVTLTRNIVKTPIQGRAGTVKEYMGEGDASISIRGIIAGPNGHWPINEVGQLIQVIQAPVAVAVVSDYLQALGIHSIVFDDRDLAQEEGGYSYQTFSLNAVSDIPQQLRISGS